MAPQVKIRQDSESVFSDLSIGVAEEFSHRRRLFRNHSEMESCEGHIPDSNVGMTEKPGDFCYGRTKCPPGKGPAMDLKRLIVTLGVDKSQRNDRPEIVGRDAWNPEGTFHGINANGSEKEFRPYVRVFIRQQPYHTGLLRHEVTVYDGTADGVLCAIRGVSVQD